MSLRCSLLGHTYGETELEREREEQGSEVVVTVREFEECERCGNQNVVSENKEVTALRSPAPDLESAESEADAGTDSDAGVAPGTGEVADEAISAGGDDAEILTDSPDDGRASEPDDVTIGTTSSGETETGTTDSGTSDVTAEAASADDYESQSAADDDGVILDDDDASSDDGERRPGEWPAADTPDPSDADEGGFTEWPDVGREDEGFDAEPGGGSADVEFGGGLTPESAPEVDGNETEEVEFVNAEGDALRAREAEDSKPELSSGISAGAEAPSLSGPAGDVDVDAEFVCPECDYRASVAGSSLRAGDICPECGRGYLAQE